MRTVAFRLVFFLTLALPAIAGATDAPRAAVFRAPGFPSSDAPAIAQSTLDAALRGLGVDTLATIDALDERLAEYSLLILPYGSAFPLDAWWPIREFVGRGGSLVVLGGAPLHQPVLRTSGGWRLGVRQPTFARELLIGPAERIEVDRGMRAVTPDPSWTTPVENARTVWTLTTRLATRADLPDEHGSEGHRDGAVRPLVHLVDEDGIPRAAPLVEIDRLRGETAGARWMFVPTDAPLPAPLIRAVVLRAMEGASELDARPVYASIAPGEHAQIEVVVRRPAPREGEPPARAAELTLRDDAGRPIHRSTLELAGTAETRRGSVAIRPERALAPGLYHVDVKLPEATRHPRTTTTGFWVRDEALLAAGPRITVSRDWLRRDGAVFPVIGTTYMASDVHRKFLFEPDPHVWDRDFAQMARLGINFVRTGIWTGWSRVMLNPGVVDEGVLRALDAYVQTAAKHGIVVNFTFYAFLPPAYGGTNPYLDPRALDGQRELLSAFAARYRGVGWIHWDLINEPSYAPREHLWTNRPMRDEWERRAWREFVAARHGDDPVVLRDRWRDASWDPFALPWDHELHHVAIREDRRPRKARDFALFSNEVVAQWAARLRAILREAGGEVLVTLGQDEGGTWFRPSQQLHAESIDYTAVHPWWQNDDLLATGITVKVPEKPMLFQETGLMRLEDVDGWPWRSPAHAAELLERKYAYAFASRGAGSIEWAWNINPYMPIDNESVIGFFRPDGTAKPELDVVPEYARFFRKAAPYLDDFEPDPVVIVIPHSRLFMNRPAATDGYRRTIRIMAERFGVVPTALSELRLTDERLRHAKLVIVPSAEFLAEEAAEALLAASRRGTKILVTGAITGDPYGAVPPALEELGIADDGRPVRLHETSRWGDVTFDRNLQESLLRSLAPPLDDLDTAVWHEPLPLEHAREDDPLAALLAAAFDAAGIRTHPSDSGIAARLLHAPEVTLAVLVNEAGADGERAVTVAGREVVLSVPAGRSKLVLFDRATGAILAETRTAEAAK